MVISHGVEQGAELILLIFLGVAELHVAQVVHLLTKGRILRRQGCDAILDGL